MCFLVLTLLLVVTLYVFVFNLGCFKEKEGSEDLVVILLSE